MFGILVFLAVLSTLVFWHELGHFIAAKACKIYVDQFSIGMPPRLFGIKVGETDYCISALPIGGYVKMAGQEDAPLSEEEREKQYGHVPPGRWLCNKPVWQRQIVFAAGPLMNFALAIALYAFIACVGSEVPEWEVMARIGNVDSQLPAATAPLYRLRDGAAWTDYQGQPDAVGWKTGDIVQSIDGKAVKNVTDVAITAILGGQDKTYYARIDREESDGKISKYLSPLKPAVKQGETRARFGVEPYQSAVVQDILPDFPSATSGLLKGDEIIEADGKPLDLDSFVKYTENIPEGQPMKVRVKRGTEFLEFNLQTKSIGRVLGLGAAPEEKSKPELAIYAVGPELEKLGLNVQDLITTVNGKPATYEQFRELERGQPGTNLKLDVKRPARLFGLWKKATNFSVDVPVAKVQAIGVSLSSKTIFRRYSVAQAIPESFRQSYLDLERTLLTLKGLITRTLSPKDLGGPVMIYDVTSKAAQFGVMEVLRIMAFISVNLCVLNLLPIPVLDGGQMVVHAFEGIFRRPLSLKFQERYQQAGLAFILILMVFVTWNDIVRMVTNKLP